MQALQDSEKALEFFQKLSKELWENLYDPYAHRAYRHHSKEARNIKKKEWKKVKKYIEKFNLPVEMTNCCMGFGCGIKIWTREYIGMETKQKCIAMITQNHIKSKDEDYQKRYKSAGFDEAWEIFLPLADSDRNRQLLQDYELPALRSKGHYEY